MTKPFLQVDVFTGEPYLGNPVAVVLGADDLDGDTMQRVARWTNLSETTFVLAPRESGADYRLRIFTPTGELPFAGHPTLGSCHAWLATGGAPADGDRIVQECSAGLIPLRRDATGRLAFAAPPLTRSGPVDDTTLAGVARELGIDRAEIVDAAWADNGPGWVAVLLADAEAVLRLRPGPVRSDIGVVGFYPSASPAEVEVRAFSGKLPGGGEDPVTGSLNAALALWLLGTARIRAPYAASQGTVLGRRGRVYVEQDSAGKVWIGGGTVTCLRGEIAL